MISHRKMIVDSTHTNANKSKKQRKMIEFIIIIDFAHTHTRTQKCVCSFYPVGRKKSIAPLFIYYPFLCSLPLDCHCKKKQFLFFMEIFHRQNYCHSLYKH